MCRHHEKTGKPAVTEAELESFESNNTDGDASGSRLSQVSRRAMLGATCGALGVLGVSGSASAHVPWGRNPFAHEYDPAYHENYTNSTRRGGDINWVVTHVTDGDFDSAVSWFKSPNNTYKTSAHYVIRNEDGYCKQMVLDEDIAHHAGGFNSPSIGIEHEWYDGQGGLSHDLLWRSGRITRHVADEYGIPLDYYTDPCEAANAPGGLVGHTDAPKNFTCSSSSKTCPWPPWHWPTYMRYVFAAGHEIIPEGWYKIENAHSLKALDVEGGSHENGANISQFDYRGTANQHWYFDHLGYGQYRLINQESGKVADLEPPRAENGANISQFEWHGGNNQRWYIVPHNGWWRIVNLQSMKVMDVEGFSTANGANVSQYDWNRTNNQIWALNGV